jgi:all-trans-8'-apo-beta-carotenal 15,15'-oxygenase
MVAYSNGYKTAYTEIPFALSSPTSGALPPDLRGTYYRAGPAMFSAGSLPPPRNSLVRPRTAPVPDGIDPGRMVRHPFEGDGAVLAITFHGDGGRSSSPSDDDDRRGDDGGGGGGEKARADTAGRATTRFRYVRTNAFTNERKRGKKLYSGMEGTRASGGGGASSSSSSGSSAVENDLPSPPFHRHHLLPGLNKMRKNTSNTRSVYFGRKLLSLWSGGLPYKLDALALSTDGRSQLGGVVKREDASMGGKAVIDSRRNRILFYGIDEEPGSSTLTVYEFNSKFQPIRDSGGVVRAKLPGLAVGIHDFSATENYAIFVQPILKVNGMQFMISKEPGKSVSLEAESSVS